MLTFRTDYDKIIKILLEFIKKFSQGKEVVIGLSGGVDSALCGMLACNALGKKKVHILVMPSRYTPEADVKDALNLAKKIAHKIIFVPKIKLEKIRKSYDKVMLTTGENENIVMDAYIRNDLLRRYSRTYGYRLLGTINGSEWRLGYYPKYSL
ncbi:NAD(+) synthase, partial [Candidatus Pacearchaeota archaeon CG06_land_8_20_14_3_00_35_12]